MSKAERVFEDHSCCFCGQVIPEGQVNDFQLEAIFALGDANEESQMFYAHDYCFAKALQPDFRHDFGLEVGQNYDDLACPPDA